MDLLTGVATPSLPAATGSNPFAVHESSAAIGDGAEAKPIALRSSMGSSREPLDLLTGSLPPQALAAAASPASSGSGRQDSAWAGDGVGQQSAFGRGSGGYEDAGGIGHFGGAGMEVAPNNPFLGNAVRSPFDAAAYSISHHRACDPASRTSGPDAPAEGSLAQFPPRTETSSMAATPAELGRRCSLSGGGNDSNNAALLSPAAGRVSRAPSAANGGLISPGSGNLPLPRARDSSKSEFSSGRLFTASSGSGSAERMEWVHNSGLSTADPLTSSSPSPPPENSRKCISDQWMPSEAGTSYRASEKEVRVSMSSSKAGPRGDDFVGAPAKGVYKPPARGAVHPRRPVSLELRPHPLRGAPTNQVTLLTCLEGSVWAVCDLGLMVWDIKNATGVGSSAKGNNAGDEDAADYDFLRVQGSTALCITVDVASQVVWTGHRDGRIRCWPGRALSSGIRESRSASLTFQAFRHAVTAILITPYGELWAGSEGELRAWPWNAVAQALTGVADSASLMENSHNNLNIGNLGGSPNGPAISPEVRFLVGDHAHGRVWCAGSQYMAIWDARTRERVKMFAGPQGLDVNSMDVGSPGRETMLDDDLKVGYAKVSSKKDKGGWLQRSRNAVMGAADALRRAASGVTLGFEEDRKLEALVAAADGTIWGGYANGVLAQWDWEGYRMRELSTRPLGVKSLCLVGNRLWVGYSDGKMNILAGDSCKTVGSWHAHRLGVIDMAVSGGYVFSLGLTGSIRGWNISSPSRDLDELMKTAMTNRADKYTRKEHIQVLVGTWNTAQEKASLQSTTLWLAPAAEASIVVVGLQEVEMGAGAIGMAAVKETVGMGMEKGSATGHWWLSHVDNVLGEEKEFERLGSRQLAGMLIGVWARRKLLPYVGDVEVGAVACGFGRTLGNKGAVGVKLNIFRRTICVLTSHLAAHMEHTSRRNADFEHIYNQMTFTRATRSNVTVVANAAAGVSSAVQNMLRAGNTSRRVSVTSDQYFIEREAPATLDLSAVEEDAGVPELADADLLIWTGDLNYRIDLSYEEAISLIKKEHWDILLLKDQLRYEMSSGRTFQGMREGAIRFSPTYKFDKWTSFYDSSEKKRVPAWCDRVLLRDSFGSANDVTDSSKLSLVRPCKAHVVRYEACMEPVDSDHKPVRCMLSVDLSVTDEADRRYQYGHIIHHDPQVQTRLSLCGLIPETSISTNRLVLEDNEPSPLRLSNGDRLHGVIYVVQSEGTPSRGPCPCGKHGNFERTSGEDQYPRGGFGFPPWLQVVSAAGVLQPGNSTSISVKFVMRPEDRGKIQKDNLCILVVNVKGVFSSEYKKHRICVSRTSASQILAKEKDGQRLRSQELHRRPSSAESDSQGYGSRPGPSTTSYARNTPDLLL